MSVFWGCKWIIVGWVVHFWLFKETHFVWLDAVTRPVNNLLNIFFNKPKCYFIKYRWILRMSSFLIELQSTEKSCTVPYKEISLCSSFVKSFDMPPEQELYQLMLSFVNL